jgi:hypothetical protein
MKTLITMPLNEKYPPDPRRSCMGGTGGPDRESPIPDRTDYVIAGTNSVFGRSKDRYSASVLTAGLVSIEVHVLYQCAPSSRFFLFSLKVLRRIRLALEVA